MKKIPLLLTQDDLQENDSPLIRDDALRVLARRYFIRSQDGVSEDTAGMISRIAWCIAEAGEKWPQPQRPFRSTYFPGDINVALGFALLLARADFLPNSPTLMNAGIPGGQLAACFVLPIEDNMESIFNTVKDAAMVHKSGGGTGFSFSRLRPKGSRVGSTNGVASGPVSFMRIYDVATEEIKQGGKRRGANMGILRVDHPDILDFIGCKAEEGNFENFNLSVGLTDEFMKAVTADSEYYLLDPISGHEAQKLPARKVWHEIVENAWLRGDPGVIFLDAINRDHPVMGLIEATNPCGESPLLPYEACNLGSINLSNFVKNGKIDFDRLHDVAVLCTEFLDNVIEASEYPIAQIGENVLKTRKIGLGVMGFADMLFKLDIPYASEKGLEAAHMVMTTIRQAAEKASLALARVRGPFPANIKEDFFIAGKPRNATTTSIAPTGTLSMLAGCSGGIEPVFALSMTKTVMDNDKFFQVNPIFLNRLQGIIEEDAELVTENKIPPMDEILDRLSQGEPLQTICPHLPEQFINTFKTAQEISPEDHLKMQSAFQEHVDLAVSKTINLPNTATRDEISDIYINAWFLGCKGVTVYRDGCRSQQVLTIGKDKSPDSPQPPDQPRAQTSIKKRPDRLTGFTHKVRTGMGELYLTVNELSGQPFEVFATIGKSGRSIQAEAEAIGRLTSLALRTGVSVSDVVKQLRGIGGEVPAFHEKRLLLSTADAVSWILEQNYMSDETRTALQDKPAAARCPECDEPTVREEGCLVCKACGWNKCG